MNLFPSSHSNFSIANYRNIDLKKILRYVWSPEAYYEKQIFKEVDLWITKKPGLLQQYIAKVALTQNQILKAVWDLKKQGRLQQFIAKDALTQAHQSPRTASQATSASPLSPLIMVPDWLEEQTSQTPAASEHLDKAHQSPRTSSLAKSSSPLSPSIMVPDWLEEQTSQTPAASEYLDRAHLRRSTSPRTSSITLSSPLSSSILVPHWLEKQTPQPKSPAASEHLDRNNFQSIWSIESQPSLTESSTSSSSGSLSPPFSVVRPGSPYPDYQIRKWSIQTPYIPILILDPRIVKFTKESSGMFKVLGSGVSGSVYHASLLSGHQLAIKLYHQAELVPHTIINEAMIMALLQNTGVVPKFYGVLPEPGDIKKLTLVQEFFGDGMTLYKLIGMMNKRQIILTEQETISLCHRLVHALKIIHSRGILINDLKNDNVLVDITNREFNIRYIDFGLATYGCGMMYTKDDDPNADTKFCFLAPEVRRGDNHTSPAADIYSLGVLIGEIGWRIDELEEISERCMDAVAMARPTMQELILMLDGLVTN